MVDEENIQNEDMVEGVGEETSSIGDESAETVSSIPATDPVVAAVADSVEIPTTDLSGIDDAIVGQPAKFPRMSPGDETKGTGGIDLILDVNIPVSVELGRTRMLIKDILDLGPGSIVELNKLAGEPVDVLVNDKLVARGEVIVINENFGVRITEILGPEERIKSLRN